MLSSLFGELRAIRGHRAEHPVDDDGCFAATTLMERVATEVTEAGQMVDNHQQDLVVVGSPAHAIRDHFATTRADLDNANRQITLMDPTGVWASSVIKALSDATGRPIERLHLREQATLRTLAVIERTTVERRHENTLRIYHADVRAPGSGNAIPTALMESSHMTAVIVGAMSPHDIDDLLATLQQAVQEPQWRCPTLLFMLPPNAVWISNKIAMYDWPDALKVQILNEALTSASAVWNALLGIWNRVKAVPPWQPAQVAEEHSIDGFPIKVADFDRPTLPPVVVDSQAARRPLAAEAADRAVAFMAGIEGLLGCAVVDAATGFTLARQTCEGEPVHVELAAAGSAQVLRAHQQASTSMGLDDHIEEIMTSAGNRHHVLRAVTRHKGLFLFALLDKKRANLALARYKLMEAEQSL